MIRAQNYNTAYGQNALPNNSGSNNSAFGFNALRDNNGGSFNTGVGANSLANNTTGDYNTAFGDSALTFNETGISNTAIGDSALVNNKSDNNTATGHSALTSNTIGTENTATGSSALSFNISGSYNTATGFMALESNQNGTYNVAAGWQTLYSNTTGYINTASGASALRTNTTGFGNTATGGNALYYNTQGSYNTGDGASALQKNTTGNYNTATGLNSLLNNNTGSNNVALGYQAGLNLTTGSNNIVIGANVSGAAGDANKIRIGKQGTQTATYIAGISGKTVASASAVAVFIDNTGKLGTVKSSARFKDQIKPMDKASEAILKLEPVIFRYKQELDPDGVTQFGLIAEQVEKVDPDLIVRDEEGKVSTVRYEAVNAMLLNEFLKEHQKVAMLEAALADEQKRSERRATQQQKQIEALTSVVQKVNDEVALQKALPRMVRNDP
jgi:trimeric autotransporter adhesin